ncbi:MAG: ABC transporter permease [Gammaproteobacteria bacterium]|nr:ABC transporter permease [Gammaproteobacteria bacterium]
MRQIWVVLRREYLERVRTKGFIIGTIALPLFMIGIMGLNIFIAVQASDSDRELALVDLTGSIGEAVAGRLDGLGYDVEVMGPDVSLEELDRQVIDDELEAYLVLDDRTLSEGVFAYHGQDSPGITRVALFESAVNDVALESYLATIGTGEELRSLIEGGRLEFESVVEVEDQAEAEAARMSGMAFGFGGAFFLYMATLLYGAFVLRSVLDEKRNRVVEVVISSVTPWRLLLGKVLGVGSMGLTQMGIWAASAGILLLVAAPIIAVQIPNADLELFTQVLPGPGALVLLIVFFLLGYFLYASLFAAVGAMCATEEEAGHAQFPVIMLLIIPLILQSATLGGGTMPWMDWVALFPFFSPIMMFPRALQGAVPWWMTGLSLVFMAGAVVGTSWVAGRIYRVGILMQGKRPTLRELVRWVKEA